MALKNILKTSGLAALGLASTAVAVAAADESPLFTPFPPMPPLPNYGVITDAIRWVFGITTGDSAALMYRLLFVVVIASAFAYFLQPVFKRNKYLGAIIGVLAGIIAVKTIPDAVFGVFGAYVGLTGSAVIVFLGPALSLWAIWYFTKDSPSKWRWRGISAIIIAVFQMGTTGFHPFIMLFDIAFIVAGAIMLYGGWRVPVIGAVAEGSRVSLSADLRKELREVLTEESLIEKAVRLVDELKVAVNKATTPKKKALAKQISAGNVAQINSEYTALQGTLNTERKLFGTLLSQLHSELSRYKAAFTGAVKTEVEETLTEISRASADESTVKGEMGKLFGQLSSMGGTTLNKTAIIGTLDQLKDHLVVELALMKKARGLVRTIEANV